MEKDFSQLTLSGNQSRELANILQTNMVMALSGKHAANAVEWIITQSVRLHVVEMVMSAIDTLQRITNLGPCLFSYQLQLFIVGWFGWYFPGYPSISFTII